jgi:glyoxalase/bleomycin resistance protein/dioxygenase superfamily protein
VLASLDYLYVPTQDVDASARWYVEELAAELVWKVRGMGTTVACLRVSESGPLVLLSGHLDGPDPIHVYRVDDYDAALDAFRAAGATDVHELEIPQGPCASLRAHGGLRLAVYELVRPGVIESFAGRVD